MFYWSRKTFKIRGRRPKIWKKLEITRTIYSNSERSEQFLVTELFFLIPGEWRFLISKNLEQLEFKLEKIIGIQKPPGKVRKNCFVASLFQITVHIFIWSHKSMILFFRNFSRTATNWTRVRLVSPFKPGTKGNYFSGCVQLGPRICLWTWTVLERYHRLVLTISYKRNGNNFYNIIPKDTNLHIP